MMIILIITFPFLFAYFISTFRRKNIKTKKKLGSKFYNILIKTSHSGRLNINVGNSSYFPLHKTCSKNPLKCFFKQIYATVDYTQKRAVNELVVLIYLKLDLTQF